MSWGRNVKASPKSGDLTAFIDEGSQIEGKYTFDGTVMMNGHFSGEIHTKDTLIVGEKGVVNASIRAGTVVISGEVVGNVLASQRVELRGTARVFGDVEAPVVVVEEGVLFEGHCKMTKGRPAEVASGREHSVLHLRRPPCRHAAGRETAGQSSTLIPAPRSARYGSGCSVVTPTLSPSE